MDTLDTLTFLRDLVVLLGTATGLLIVLYVITLFRKDD